MSVATLRETMTGAEYQAWGIYYEVKAQKMKLANRKGGKG